jgi:hypothetical protein
MKMLAVYDVKSESYEVPFFKVNEQIAMREFALVCRDEQMLMNKFPEDYELHLLGEFDQSECSFVFKNKAHNEDAENLSILPRPKILCTAKQCLVLEERNDA